MWKQKGVLQRFVVTTVNRHERRFRIVVLPHHDGSWFDARGVVRMEDGGKIAIGTDIGENESTCGSFSVRSGKPSQVAHVWIDFVQVFLNSPRPIDGYLKMFTFAFSIETVV